MDSLPSLAQRKTRGGLGRRWTRSRSRVGVSPFTEKKEISQATAPLAGDRRGGASEGAS